MQDQSVRELVWKELYEADIRTRYFGTLAGKMKTRERWLAAFVAIGSASGVITILGGVPYAPLLLNAVVAVAAAIVATQKFEKAASVGAEIGAKWDEIRSGYEVLWLEIDDLDKTEVLARHRQLEKKHRQSDQLSMGEFKVDEKLLVACRNQSLAGRGLAEAA